ncbi:MAG: FAD-dependent oxidoreductase [Acidobacteriia bacterium]|nr:FAD-dependent oxidoreductase [Terriglobia bacterium]
MAFQFERPRNFLFNAGQFVDLAPRGPRPDGSDGLTHTFSIVSSPLAEEIVMATRMRDTAFKRALSILPIGAEVRIKGPMGSFTLHKNVSRPAVFLAGGIGIAPFLSMLSYAAVNKPHPAISLFYANRYLEDAAFMDTLRELESSTENFRFVPTLTGGTTLTGDGRARLATSAQKCFPNMYPTCKARSAMSPGHQP